MRFILFVLFLSLCSPIDVWAVKGYSDCPALESGISMILSRDSTVCDVIIFTDGSRLSVKVLVVGENDIEFKYCDNLKGPTARLPKKSIAQIYYPNGTSDIFAGTPIKNATPSTAKETVQPVERKYVERKIEAPTPPAAPEKQAEGLGLGSFGLLIVGYVLLFAKSIWGLLFLSLGVLMGFWSWFRISKSNGKFGQVGWSYAAIIFGILGILALLLLVGI